MATRGARLPSYVLLLLIAAMALGPMLILVLNSLKSPAEVVLEPIGIPEVMRFDNYAEAFTTGNLGIAMVNSAIVVTGTVIGVCAISSLAAYAIARLPIRGVGLITLGLLVLASFPAHLFLVPLFFLWRNLGLLDTQLGLIVIYWALYSPFATFLMRAFMVTIPAEFDDAARIDGAGTLGVIRHVILPMVWPGLLTVALLAGLWAWNEFLFARTFILTEPNRTVTASLSAFTDRFYRDWAVTSAAAVIVALPVLAFFFALQRRFIEGLTQGGLRG